MCRIKLLILLFVSIIYTSCVTNYNQPDSLKFSISPSTQGIDGLIFSNFLKTYLQSYNSYDVNSELLIISTIIHDDKYYITNINNTSDRVSIKSNLNVRVVNKSNECELVNYSDSREQFYIISSSQTLLSNEEAEREIKQNNADILAYNLLNYLLEDSEYYCLDEPKY